MVGTSNEPDAEILIDIMFHLYLLYTKIFIAILYLLLSIKNTYYPLVIYIAIKHGPFIVSFPIKDGGSFHSCVSLPEGNPLTAIVSSQENVCTKNCPLYIYIPINFLLTIFTIISTGIVS